MTTSRSVPESGEEASRSGSTEHRPSGALSEHETFEGQAIRRRRLDRRRLHQAFVQLAQALDPRNGPKRDFRESGEPLFEACRLVAQAGGIELRLPLSSRASTSLLELSEANGLRHRKVLLRDEWWRRDNGPLLAYFKGQGDSGEERRPVALLPLSGGRRYELIDPATGERRPVTADLASELDADAYMFYPPLPHHPLKFRDLVRAASRGRGRDLMALALVSMGVGLLSLLLPLVTQRIVDVAIVRSDTIELIHLTVALGVAAVAAAIFQAVRGLLVVRLKGKLDGSLQAALWDRLISLPVPFFRRFTVGDLEARSMGIGRIRDQLGGFVTSSLLSGVAALFSLAILFYYSMPLALVASASALVLATVVGLIAALQLRHQRALYRHRGKMASFLYALLSGVVKLRVGNAELRAYSAWAERFAKLRRREVIVQRLTNIQTAFSASYGVVAVLLIFALVGFGDGMAISVGEFLAFFVAFGQFQAAASSIIGVIPSVLEAVPIYERMTPILEAVPEGEDRSRGDAAVLRGDIEMRNVSFRYHETGELVLDNVSIRASAGEFVALVGPSGSGKTTCVRLLLGFEQAESGQVLIDGRVLEDLDVHSIRRQMGVVLQNSRPLVGDIFHNIVGARPLTKQDAWRAAREVGLDDVIRELPMGMHTFVNQRGASFSGGQRQRLLLARAIVENPRVLLLDEATSALDNQTQDLVIRNLEAMNVTRFVVAHRLSTIRHADRIYVLDHGRVVQQGRFEELVHQDGLFQRIIQRQMTQPDSDPNTA